MDLSKLDELRLNMINAKKEFDEKAIAYAVENCGHKFGDVVEVNRYSHKGKSIKISSIALSVDNWKKEYFAVLSGNVLNKDGSVGKNEGQRLISLGVIG